MNPKFLALYHYYRPDDVAGAAQFTGLCEGLAERGFEVEVWPGNRACHNPQRSFGTKLETMNGVKVRRIMRPPLSQHSFLGRVLNSIWMQKRWWWRLFLSPSCKPDIILIGTDPIFSLGLVPFLKFLRPKAKIVHWCFDLYPEAAVADGMMGEKKPLVRMARWWMRRGYGKCDFVVVIGSCMGERLKSYGIQKNAILTPWAQEEPEDPSPLNVEERETLFGEASLGLLYSGSFGRAHDFYLTLKLARLMGDRAVFVYGVRGSRLESLRKAVNPEDKNIRFAIFAPEDRLKARLSAPDVHLVSLRPEWTGVVVPSKFFGALAVGRPVLFEGDDQSSIARWIKEYKVGWVLNHNNLEEIREELLCFSKGAKQKTEMFRHCHEIYKRHFSKKIVMDAWDKELRSLIGKQA